jgi:hypothetical protein
MISRKGCEKMLQSLGYLNSPIDWYFNFVIQTQKLENYWAEPELSLQNLSFESAINAGNVQ